MPSTTIESELLDSLKKDNPDAAAAIAAAPEPVQPQAAEPAPVATEPAAVQPPAETAPAQPTPGQQAQADFFAVLEKEGAGNLRDKYKTPEELARGIVNAQRMLGKRSEYEDYGRYLVQTAALPEDQRREAAKRLITQVLGLSVDEAQGEPQQPQPHAPQPSQPENGQGLPEWNEQWQHQFRYDREKNQWITVDPEANPADLQKYLHALQSRKQLLANPEKYLGPLVEQRARALIDPLRQEMEQQRQYLAAMQQHSQAAQQAQQVTSLRNSVASWAQAGYDPMTGQPTLTPLGQMLDKQASLLASQGMHPLAAIQSAMQIMELNGHLKDGQPVQAAPPPAQPAPATTSPARNLGPALATTTAADTRNNPTAAVPSRPQSIEQRMIEALRRDGML